MRTCQRGRFNGVLLADDKPKAPPFILGYSGFVVGKGDGLTALEHRAIPSGGIVAERSSPSRLRFAAPSAALTALGRSENLSAMKEWAFSGLAP
jgi:hypothetical protein